ncbi:MAG: cadherin-like domain-containing protein, partial [Planctomycetota bacterium]
TAFSVDSENVAGTVNAVNDDPVIAFGSGNINFIENDPPIIIDATVAASDIDGLDFDGGSLTVRLTSNATANDRLSIAHEGTGAGEVGVSTGPHEISYGGTVVGTWSGEGEPLSVSFNANANDEAVQAVMRRITYSNVSDTPSTDVRTVEFELADGDGGSSNLIQKDISVTPTNDAPTIGNLDGDTLNYNEGAGLVLVEQGVDVVTNDPDSPDYNDGILTVQITNNGVSTEDVISIRSEGDGPGQISIGGGNSVRFEGEKIGTFAGGDSGNPFTIEFNAKATNDGIAAAIESIVYENTNGSDPSSAPRTIDFTLSDGDGATSVPYSVTVNIVTLNDAPEITFNGVGQTYTENGVGRIVDTTVTIVDPDGVENISGGELVILVTGNGTADDQLIVLHEGTGPGELEVAGNTILVDSVVIATFTGGTSASDPLVVTFAAAADTSHAEQIAQRVAFANTSDAPSELQRTVSFQITDAGGATSFMASHTMDVVAVNDAPVVSVPTSIAATEQVATSLVGLGLTVADFDSSLNTVTATLTVAEGTVSANQGDSGVSISGSGSSTLTLTGTIQQINQLLTGGTSGDVTYLNGLDAPSSSVNLTLTVNDQGNVGLDPGLSGDTVSEEGSASTTILITATNDAPTTATASATGPEDTTIAITLSGSDIDGTVDHFVLSNLPANGTLYLDSSLTIPVTTGTELNATSETLELYFDPDENWNGSTSFEYVARDDGSLDDASPATASITVTPVNDAPDIVNNQLTLSEGDSITLSAVELSTADPDTADSSVVYTVGNVSGGQFEFASSPQVAITTFTNADVLAGDVVFVHDGSEDAPAYDVEVTDGELQDGPAAATIDLTNVNDAPILAGIGGDRLTVANDGTPSLIDVAAPATLVDPDSPADYQGAELQVTGQLFDSLDTLSIDTTGNVSLSAGVTDGSAVSVGGKIVGVLSATSNSGLTITFTTVDATSTDVDTLLQSLTFESTSSTYGKRTLELTFNDGDGTANGGVDTSKTAIVTLAVAEAGSGFVATDEDVTYSFSRMDFDFTGVTSSFLRTLTIESLPTEGTLMFNGSPATVGTEITSAEIDAGLLEFVPSANENGPIYANFQLSVNGGNSSVTVLAGEPTAFTLNGGELASTDAILANSDNFGLTGQVSTGISVAASSGIIDADYLADGDVLFNGLVPDGSWDASELAEVDRWVADGGILISTSDSALYDDVSAHFGLTIGGDATSNWNLAPTNFLSDGAFGQVTGPIEAAGSIGFFDPASLDVDDQVLATDGNGQPTIVLREHGDGFIVFTTDEGIFRANMASHGSVTSSNEIMVANLFAWAADQIPGDERYTMSIDVNPVNDDPFNAGTLPTNATAAEDVSSDIDLSSVDLVDIDTVSGELSLTLEAQSGGRLTAGTGSGVTIDNNGTSSITLTGTQADLNAFLDSAGSVQYTSALNDFGVAADTIDVTLNDNGNEGIGGGLDQSLGSVTIDITPVNDEEVIDINTTLNLDEGDSAVISDSLLSSSDVDNTASELTYTIVNSASHGLVLKNGVATTTFTQSDIDSGVITYEHDGSESLNDSFDFNVDDGSGTATTGTFSVTWIEGLTLNLSASIDRT